MQMKKTKEIILAKALEMFNEHGIETAGIREIARSLSMSPGNVSYYFPSKTDLITAIFELFESRQNELLALSSGISDWNSLKPFLQKSLLLQDEFRCLFISIGAIAAVPELVERTSKLETQRRQQLGALLKQLPPVHSNNHMDVPLIVRHLLLSFRFRLLDAQLRPTNKSLQEQHKSFLQDTRKFLSLFFSLN